MSCPNYNDETEDFTMYVSRMVLSQFLVDTFINNPSGLITPVILMQKIIVYPEVGKVIYNRFRSVKCPPIKYANVTVMQIIARGPTRIKCYCRLVLNILPPANLNDAI